MGIYSNIMNIVKSFQIIIKENKLNLLIKHSFFLCDHESLYETRDRIRLEKKHLNNPRNNHK